MAPNGILRFGRSAAIAGLIGIAACGRSMLGIDVDDPGDGIPDGGVMDAGDIPDGGVMDAGGTPDSGEMDAGVIDAGEGCADTPCGPGEVCDAESGACICAVGYAVDDDGQCKPECPLPLAPVLSVIDAHETLVFVAPAGFPIEVAVLPANAPVETALFMDAEQLPLSDLMGPSRVLARTHGPGCVPVLFDAVYDVRDSYAPAPPAAGTTAVASDDPHIVGWATGVAGYLPGPGVSAPKWMMPTQALGPAGTDPTMVVTLGNGGQITLSFDPPITNGEGWDFAVYENSFAGDTYLELGFVEVSSDGTHFLRFDAAFRGAETPCAACSGAAVQIGGLAGSYAVGYGTPFDLDALRSFPLARDGTVDLSHIRYVRIVDVVGDGTTMDAFGRGIIDPLQGSATAGFDLDGIAVLHQQP
ncbi:cell surface protein [Minicystis rosea]|nr:cell surface protein [Minicystis rosea]